MKRWHGKVWWRSGEREKRRNERILKAWIDGASVEELAARFRLSATTINSVVTSSGVRGFLPRGRRNPKPPTPRPKTDGMRARAARNEAIRAAIASGESQAQVAERFDLTRERIRQIVINGE